jgi:hypothetical protein
MSMTSPAKPSPAKPRHLLHLALLACSVAGALAASPAFAQAPPPAWQGVYEGTIGKAHVVLALTPISTRYFYLGKANDLGLMIPDDGNLSKLQETLAPDMSDDDIKKEPKLVTGVWSLSYDKGALSGTWKDPGGKNEQPIALKRLSTGDEGTYAVTMTLDNPGVYTAHWLRAAPALVASDKETTIGPLTLKNMRDPSFGGEVPRLVKAPEGVRIDAVNAGLERLQRYLRATDRECFQGSRTFRARTSDDPVSALDKKSDDDDDNATILKATFATDHLLTLEESHMTFCGGAHPNMNIGMYTFDLSDGALVTGARGGDDEFDDLGPKGLGRALDLGTASKRAKFDSFWKGAMRVGIAADRAATKAAEKGKKDKKEDGDDGDCSRLTEAKLKEKPLTIHAYPTSKGLAVRVADFPHYAEVCEVTDPINPVVLPYAALKPFLKPGQTLLPTGK